MFTGDHVLGRVTPHVGVWAERLHNPLQDYVNSLRKVAEIGASGVLPAHGEPFPDLAARVAELLAHHDVREAQVMAVLARGPATAGAVARELPWTHSQRAFATLSDGHKQFAVAETISHLELLRSQGLATRVDDGPEIVYASG
jgi:glyoxylase-like metal-dependent hydrolase (beta-lactamase superfamily II)